MPLRSFLEFAFVALHSAHRDPRAAFFDFVDSNPTCTRHAVPHLINYSTADRRSRRHTTEPWRIWISWFLEAYHDHRPSRSLRVILPSYAVLELPGTFSATGGLDRCTGTEKQREKMGVNRGATEGGAESNPTRAGLPNKAGPDARPRRLFATSLCSRRPRPPTISELYHVPVRLAFSPYAFFVVTLVPKRVPTRFPCVKTPLTPRRHLILRRPTRCISCRQEPTTAGPWTCARELCVSFTSIELDLC